MGDHEGDGNRGEEGDNFVEDVPEDLFALEELMYPEISKCRKRGARKRDKFAVPSGKD